MSDEVITVVDRNDPRIAPFVGIRDPVLRRDSDCFIAEGPDIVRQCVELGLEFISALVDGRFPRPSILPVECLVWAADPVLIGQITGLGVHRGVLALVRRPAQRAATDLLATAKRVVVLVGVENPVNVGLIARSAAGLGIDALLLDPTSADPLYRRSVTASRGATLHLPWARIESIADFCATGSFTTVALTPDRAAPSLRLLRLAAFERIAVVVGAEGPGLAAETIRGCTFTACIPMAHVVDSLNVATAVAIACWELGAGEPKRAIEN